MRRIEELFQLYVEFLTWSFLKPALTTINSETSLMRPPSGSTIGGLIKEVAVLLKTSLMQPFNKLALLARVSNSLQLKSNYWTFLSFIIDSKILSHSAYKVEVH